MMKKRIIYCHKKHLSLESQAGRIASFDDVIKKINEGAFLVLEREKEPNKGQFRFLVRIEGYPIIVPFNERETTVQLITLFPDRRFK